MAHVLAGGVVDQGGGLGEPVARGGKLGQPVAEPLLDRLEKLRAFLERRFAPGQVGALAVQFGGQGAEIGRVRFHQGLPLFHRLPRRGCAVNRQCGQHLPGAEQTRHEKTGREG